MSMPGLLAIAAFLVFALNVLAGFTTLALMEIGVLEFGRPPRFLWIGMVASAWLSAAALIGGICRWISEN